MSKSTFTIATALVGLFCLPACGTPGSDAESGGPTVTTDDDSTGGSEDETTGNPTSSSGDGDGDSGGTIFVDSTDDGGPDCGEQCDIWAEGDCPEGEKCTAVACEVGSNSWDSNVCRPINGDAAPGDECMYTDGSGVSGNDDCGEGSMCWNADGDTGIGTCVAFCTGSPAASTCASGTTCAILNDGVLPLCLPGCDPLAQDCESSNEICLPDPSGSGYICALDASGDMAPYGTPCNYANVCNSGLLCINAEGVPEAECASAQGCCSPMCSISSGDACPGDGQSCEPVFEMQPPGFEDVGICTIAG